MSEGHCLFKCHIGAIIVGTMRKRIIPLLIFLFCALVLFFFSKNLSYPAEHLGTLLTSSRIKLYSLVYASSKPSAFDTLTLENNKLREQLAQMDAIKNDNQALRSQFQDTVFSPQQLLPVKIIGFSGSIDSPTVLISDQGTKSGVAPHQAVILGHTLVGEIGNVTPFNSEIILTNNKNFRTLGTSSDNKSSGIVTGQEDFILLDHVVITDTIPKNGTVVSKGEQNESGVGIPAGLVIGKIISINKSETEPFQSAIMKPLIDFRKLTTVFVVK